MLSSSRLFREAVGAGFVLFLALLSPVSGRADDSAPMASRVRASATPAQLDLIPGCDDRNGCTIDAYDTTSGTCRHDPLSCDDGNPCTRDFCQDGFVGGCRHEALADATPCDDGEGCTQGDACSAGVCVAGAILDANAPCDDGNSCTVDDACDASRHCRGTALGDGAACDDGNACTQDERCVTAGDGAVACMGTAPDCSDGDLCTEDRCDPATGQCLHLPVSCADGNTCTTDVCDPATGLCRRDNIAGPCEDGRYCTVNDVCTGGNCVGQQRECLQPTCGSARCDYEDDFCRITDGAGCPPSGQCYSWFCQNGTCHLFNDSLTPCVLPGYCGIAQCIRGGCTGVLSIPCVDDGNACTDEVCPQGSCTHPAKPDGTPCLDQCHTCQGGACSDTQVNCDDGNACTNDSCDPVVGCVHAPVDCSDGNSCTIDQCSAATGCQHQALAVGDFCDDGIACTQQDRCSPIPGGGTTCVGTVPCDDGNPCTLDTGGVDGEICSCRHTPLEVPCCEAGMLVSCDDGDVCTVDACDGATGACRYDPLTCDDGNSCTEDVCEPETGCVSRAETRNGLACDDLNACTRDDRCADGVCGGTTRPDGEPCDDGNACTAEDRCGSGRCQGLELETGTPCDDGNSCTADDQCLFPETGDLACRGVARPIGASCNDGSLCTTDDRCLDPPGEGDPACLGTILDCADENPCTQDACDAATGRCAHPVTSCEDGNPCTLDSCSTLTGECGHEPVSQPVTCGVGACQRTVDVCSGAGACVPGTPSPETCNGIDDDCDGQVDERTLQPVCTVRPTTMKEGASARSFTVTCLLSPSCSPTPSRPDVSAAWISAVDLSLDPSDDVTFPDPATAACGAIPGLPGEKGIVEDVAHRTMSDASVIFVFDRPSDGVCATLDGGRPDLTTLMAPMPDRAVVRVCVSTRIDGQAPVQSCGKVRKGNGSGSAPHWPRPE